MPFPLGGGQPLLPFYGVTTVVCLMFTWKHAISYTQSLSAVGLSDDRTVGQYDLFLEALVDTHYPSASWARVRVTGWPKH